MGTLSIGSKMATFMAPAATPIAGSKTITFIRHLVTPSVGSRTHVFMVLKKTCRGQLVSEDGYDLQNLFRARGKKQLWCLHVKLAGGLLLHLSPGMI